MQDIRKPKFWMTAALAFVTVPVLAEAASAGSLIKWLDPFNTAQGTYVVGAPPTTLNAPPVTISSPLLGSGVTRGITGTKTEGSFDQVLDAKIANNRYSFNNQMGVSGRARVNYGTFAAVDFTHAGTADSIALGINALAIVPLSSTPGNFAFKFNFTDSDGTSGTIARNFSSSVFDSDLFLSFADATRVTNGVNGVLDFNRITAFSFDTEISGNIIVQSAFKPLAIGSSTGSPSPAPLLLPLSNGVSGGAFSGIVFPSQDPPSTPEPGTIGGLLALGVLGIAGGLRARGKN
jgi:hypothetical protein